LCPSIFRGTAPVAPHLRTNWFEDASFPVVSAETVEVGGHRPINWNKRPAHPRRWSAELIRGA
jgi:hypothetical protein